MQKIHAEVTGTVWKVEVTVGQTVSDGDTLVIIESMKMEIPVDATMSGVVTELLVAEGEAVADGQHVATIG